MKSGIKLHAPVRMLALVLVAVGLLALPCGWLAVPAATRELPDQIARRACGLDGVRADPHRANGRVRDSVRGGTPERQLPRGARPAEPLEPGAEQEVVLLVHRHALTEERCLAVVRVGRVRGRPTSGSVSLD